jgi:uncharacterized protein YjbI with pentapeptide repeats
MADQSDAAEAERPNPFDVEALGDAVNDSASRVSTIWVSFLIFSLYMLVAAGTVTHRQLFLDEPTKLPVLNIDLPLWWFFLLAPILFVIFHVYVLLQVLLLGRTAAAYNAAAAALELSSDENIALRQRLANTIFAQIFAGSPREREGFVGSLLNAMAWITLAITPVLILLAFQFRFLPYHSEIVTSTHRALIVIELISFFVIWPLALDAQRNFQWPNIGANSKQFASLRVFNWNNQSNRTRLWLRQHAGPLASGLLYICVCFGIASFPGEPHLNFMTGQPWSSVKCDRWLQKQYKYADLRFDRLNLQHADTIDHEKLEKIEAATEKAREKPYEGERTRILRGRDFNCADLSDFADLRRVDLGGSRLRNANLDTAKLQGAVLDKAELEGAHLNYAQLQGASFNSAQLQRASIEDTDLRGASLDRAKLQYASLKRTQFENASLEVTVLTGAILFAAKLNGASLLNAELEGADLHHAELHDAHLFLAHLQGADLSGAELQGATLASADLSGADLYEAQLQGANLNSALLRGARLDNADLRGAFLGGAQLQGASIRDAQLQGASLASAWLQGAAFDEAKLTYAKISNAFVWRAKNAACQDSWVSNHRPDPVIFGVVNPVPASPDEIAKFIEASVAGIPSESRKKAARKRMRAGLVDPSKDDLTATEVVWHKCELATSEHASAEFDHKHAEFLRDLICDDSQHGETVAKGIVAIWISSSDDRREFSTALAVGLLGLRGRNCAAMKYFDADTMKRLREAFTRAVPANNPSK